MLWNASALSGYPIKATDGQLGTVAGLMYSGNPRTSENHLTESPGSIPVIG